jgi:hypothetical protein
MIRKLGWEGPSVGVDKMTGNWSLGAADGVGAFHVLIIAAKVARALGFVSPRWGLRLGLVCDPGRRSGLACPGLACWGPLARFFWVGLVIGGVVSGGGAMGWV